MLSLDLIDFFLNTISTKHALTCGKGLGRLSYALYERGKTTHTIHHIVGTVLNSAPDHPDVHAIVKHYFSHLGQLIVEVARTKHLRSHWHDITEIRGLDHFQAALKQRSGIVLLSAHLGNWEYIISGLPFLTGVSNPHVIAWKQPDTYINRLLDKKRAMFGTTLLYSQELPIPRRRSGRGPVDTLLGENGILLVFADSYDIGRTKVNFFGHNISVASGPFVFAQRTNSPVVPVYTIRQGQKHIITFESPYDLEPLRKGERNVADYLQDYIQAVEHKVRESPEQYMWILRQQDLGKRVH